MSSPRGSYLFLNRYSIEWFKQENLIKVIDRMSENNPLLSFPVDPLNHMVVGVVSDEAYAALGYHGADVLNQLATWLKYEMGGKWLILLTDKAAKLENQTVSDGGASQLSYMSREHLEDMIGLTINFSGSGLYEKLVRDKQITVGFTDIKNVLSPLGLSLSSFVGAGESMISTEQSRCSGEKAANAYFSNANTLLFVVIGKGRDKKLDQFIGLIRVVKMGANCGYISDIMIRPNLNEFIIPSGQNKQKKGKQNLTISRPHSPVDKENLDKIFFAYLLEMVLKNGVGIDHFFLSVPTNYQEVFKVFLEPAQINGMNILYRAEQPSNTLSTLCHSLSSSEVLLKTVGTFAILPGIVDDGDVAVNQHDARTLDHGVRV